MPTPEQLLTQLYADFNARKKRVGFLRWITEESGA